MPSAKPAFLYVIGGASGPHKVGLSKDPRRRLSQLQVSTHQPLTLKKVTATAARDPRGVEGWAHWLMRDRHLRGEWFDVAEEEAWKHLQAAELAVLCDRPIPYGIRRMGVGRPKLSATSETKPTMVRFTAETRQRILDLVGPQGMSAFIRSAVEAELTRRERPRPNPKTD